MKIDNINGIVIPQNHVLVKLPNSYKKMVYNEVKIGSFDVNTSYELAMHTPRYGELIVNPEKLYLGIGGMSWETTIETQVGDTVWFNYLVCLMALGRLANPVSKSDDESYFVCGDDLYVFLPYESLVVARRKHTFKTIVTKTHTGGVDPYEENICLNGYCIGEPVVEKQSEILIANKKPTGKVKITHVGVPVENYLGDEFIPSCDVKVGDVVMVKKAGNKMLAEKLENGMVNKFDERELVFFQNKQILCKE